MSEIPTNWSGCACGQPCLDGHLTCGDLHCNEKETREARLDELAYRQSLAAGRAGKCPLCLAAPCRCYEEE